MKNLLLLLIWMVIIKNKTAVKNSKSDTDSYAMCNAKKN